MFWAGCRTAAGWLQIDALCEWVNNVGVVDAHIRWEHRGQRHGLRAVSIERIQSSDEVRRCGLFSLLYDSRRSDRMICFCICLSLLMAKICVLLFGTCYRTLLS